MKTVQLKRITDVILIILVLVVSVTPVNYDTLHEILGIILIIVIGIHLFLNRHWIVSLKSKMSLYSTILLIINILLLISLLLLALSAVSLSRVVFNGITIFPVSIARRIHLSMSFWFLVLTGIHLGFNWNQFIPGKYLKRISNSKLKPYLMTLIFTVAIYGAWTFNTNRIIEYMFFTQSYLNFEYLRNIWLTLINNFSILVLWTFISSQIAKYIIHSRKKDI